MRRRRNIAVVAVAATFGAIVVTDADAAGNIAEGRPYTLSIPPNYPLCTDDGDATDLTDGVVAAGVSDADRDAASSLWGMKSAVGWNHARQLPQITIDLGELQPIDGVGLHTASGASGVSAFRSIPIMVSDDGETFTYAGDLVGQNTQSLPPDYPGYDVYWLKARDLATKGRYVKLVLIAGGVFGFADEVEVYRGDDALLDQPAPGEAMTLEQLKDPARLTRLGAQTRVRRDLQILSEMVAEGPRGAKRDKLEARIDEVSGRVAGMSLPGLDGDAMGFRAVVPFNDLHAEVYALYGQMLEDAGFDPLTVWQSEPHDILPAFRPPGRAKPKLDIDMMGNERRSDVFNLTNASAEPLDVSFRIEQLSGGDNPGFVKAYQVESVDTREGAIIPAALTPLEATDGAYHTTVPAGMTRQVWLAFESYNNAVAPGEHTGAVRVNAELPGGRKLEHRIPVALNVVDAQLPDDDRFGFMTWDYIFGKAYGITDGNRAASRQHVLDDPLVNGVWGTGSELPFPSGFDAEGNIVGDIDFERWDAFVEFWPDMKHYFVFAVWRVGNTPGGLTYGTPAFDRGMAQWAAAWAEHNRSLGLEPGQAVVLFIDEPAGEDWLKASYECAKAFNAGTDDILTFTDPHINSPDEEYGRLNAEAYDIVCPHLPAWPVVSEAAREAYHAVAKNENQEMWFYSCSGPSRVFDLDYFRLQPWHAFNEGGTGGGFWAYAPSAAPDSWNEYAHGWRANYALPYVGPEGVTGSKQWEAAREGVQDYLYLSLLADQLAEGGLDGPSRRRAERILDAGVDAVVGQDDSAARLNTAEKTRREVLKLLNR